jgi:glycosyltransferase involved in cell wall biosynthesis
LRICLLSYRSNPHCGGQGVYVRNLSRALTALGHRVDVLAGPPDPQLDRNIRIYRIPCLDLYNPENPFRVPSLQELSNPVNFLEWAGVSTMGFPEPYTFGLRAYHFLRGKFNRYDIIHDNQHLSFGLWAMSRFVPTTATIHHPITIDRKISVDSVSVYWKKAKALRWYSFIAMQKQVARKLQHIITVSECAKNDIRRDFHLPENRFTVVPNGINTELFYPIPEIPRETNRLIVTNSADMPMKGLYHLLHAVAKIAARRPIRLVVIGTPKKNGGVVRLIRQLQIGRHITFTGRISYEEFVRQYARSTVAVVPSVYEGFGLPVGEAMACGVPVVSTTGGALPEVVGDAGLLVPPADSEALARAIITILDHPSHARKLGEAGYQRVQQHFTWKKAAEKTVHVYRKTIRDYRRF